MQGVGLAIDTKERVLEAALVLFAERGFHNATVRDIAARAKTNVASINYYFRSKDDLYHEVLAYSFRCMIDAGDAAIRNAGSGTREDRLRAFISSLIPKPEEECGKAQHVRLIAWEMLSPTGALDQVGEMEIKPQLEHAKDIIRPFLPEGMSEQELNAAALWLVGQCIVFRGLAENLRRDLFPDMLSGTPTDELAALVSRLALGGLQSGIR